MEGLRTKEIATTIVQRGVAASRFILSRLAGGGWSELPALPNAHKQRNIDIEAAMHYYGTGNNAELEHPTRLTDTEWEGMQADGASY